MRQDFLAAFILLIVVSSLGVIFSALLMWLIYYQNKDNIENWKSNSKLLFFAAMCDMLTFVFQFFSLFADESSDEQSQIHLVGRIVRGVLGFAAYSLIAMLTFSMFYLLYYGEPFEVLTKERAVYVFTGLLIPSVVWLVIIAVGLSEGDYGLISTGVKLSAIFRIIPIVFTIICYTASVLTVRELSKTNSINLNAITTMVDRYKWYPVLQILSRIFPTWSEIEFPFTSKNNDDYIGGVDQPYKYTLFMLGLIFRLVGPIGFILVYINCQPKARKIIASYFGIERVSESKRSPLMSTTYTNGVSDTVVHNSTSYNSSISSALSVNLCSDSNSFESIDLTYEDDYVLDSFIMKNNFRDGTQDRL